MNKDRIGRVGGEVALVTGSALGIGRSAALLLAQEGAKVAVTDILDEEGEALVREINESGGTARYWHLDVADEAEVTKVFEEINSSLGAITVLVNNAGISGVNKPTHEITSEEWDHLMNVNVKGVFFATKHAVPQMMRAGHGSIINLSSIYGLVSAPDVPPYHASKGAVRMMTKTDALIYAQYRIRVNSIHPGFINTPMVDHFLHSLPEPEAAQKALEAMHPLGHMGEPEDIAYGILYLASPESKFVTGSELVIDGGYTCR